MSRMSYNIYQLCINKDKDDKKDKLANYITHYEYWRRIWGEIPLVWILENRQASWYTDFNRYVHELNETVIAKAERHYTKKDQDQTT